jgi:hypothetical protein
MNFQKGTVYESRSKSPNSVMIIKFNLYSILNPIKSMSEIFHLTIKLQLKIQI